MHGEFKMLKPIKNISRFLKIVLILARYDALFFLEILELNPSVIWLAKKISKKNINGRKGERLASALSEAGPSFIKLGQALSTRSDIFGEEITSDLSRLQDALPPFSSKDARATIVKEFGQPLEAIFKTFNDIPIAAASIAQVHFAETIDGTAVAVKILRPQIENAFAKDLNLFLWIANFVEKNKPEWKRLKPVELIKSLAYSVEIEMDLRFEAAAAVEISENFKDDSSFNVPSVDWSRTGRSVLTTSRIIGIPIDDKRNLLKAGHNLDEIVKKTSKAFFNQVFRDGFFHADLHPGNIFVQDDGNIAVVDFGIMGRIDRRTRRWLGEMLLGFLNRNYQRVAEIHFEAGWVPPQHSIASFKQACISIAEPILDKPQNEISIARLLAHLFKVTKTFDMEAQPQLLLLQKTMFIAEGTVRKLNPSTNMWALSRPFIEEWIADFIRPEKIIFEEIKDINQAVHRLPTVLRGVEQTIAKGELKLNQASLNALKGSEKGSKNFFLLLLLVILMTFFLLLLGKI